MADRRDRYYKKRQEQYNRHHVRSDVPVVGQTVSPVIFCGPQRKYSYPSRAAAKRAARQATEPSRPYDRPHCQYWHLTTHDQDGNKL